MIAYVLLGAVYQAGSPTIEAADGKIAMNATDVDFINLSGQSEPLSLTSFLQRVARGEDAAEGAASAQENTNNLLVEVRDILQGMAGAQEAAAGAQAELLGSIFSQLEANNPKSPATAAGLQGVVWSGTSANECETTGCRLTIRGRGFIDGATEVYTVTAALPTSAGHILIEEDVMCPSSGSNRDLGTSASLGECTEKCAGQGDCRYFGFGKGANAGNCWAAADCRGESGFEAAEYDFFKLSQDAGQSVMATVLSVTPSKIEVEFNSFELPPAAEFSTTLAIEEGGACAATGCSRATVPYIAGDPGAFLNWKAKGPTMNFPVANDGTWAGYTDGNPITFDFTVGDDDHDLSTLIVSAISSDETLIRTDDISFSTVGDGGAVMMTATYVSEAVGETTVGITVTDPLGMSVEISFRIELEPVPPVAANCDGKDTSTNWATSGTATMSPEDPHWGPNAGAINDGSLGWGGTHISGWWKVSWAPARIITKLRVYQCYSPYFWGNYKMELLTTANEWVTVVDQDASTYGRDDSFDITPVEATELRFTSKGSHPQGTHRIEQIYAYGCSA